MYKINRLHIYVLILAALLLHVTVLNHLYFFGIKFDLLLILVVFAGLFLGEGAGLEFGFVAGFLRDIFTLDYFGVNTFTLGITGLLAGFMSTKFAKETRAPQFFLMFFFTVFYGTLHYVLISFFSKGLLFTFTEYLLTSVIPAAIYTCIIALMVFAKLIDVYGLRELEDLI